MEPPLVGRTALVDSLCRAVDTAAGGRGALVLLAGEAGIGKTALAAEVVRYAADLGLATAWGSCEAGDATPGLWPWRRILGSVAGPAGPFAPHGAWEVAGVDAQGARLALFERITEALLGRGALVAVLDDLQWADPASVLLLDHLARRARHEPLLLLGTYRDVELADDHRLRALSGADVVALGGLAPADVGVLLERIGGAVGQERAESVHRRTGGNPFFVQQIARLRAAGGDNGAVPAAVGQVVARRLARLPDTTARLLGTAAVIGRSFGVGLLASVARLPDVRLPDLLAPAVEARIVARDEEGPGYSFVHDLFREELAAQLAPVARARTHLAVAHALEGSERVAELARHYADALPVGPVGPAVDYAVRAARAAMDQLAFEEAVRQWRRAVRLSGDGEARTVRMRLELAEAQLCAGMREAAVEGFGAVARASNDPGVAAVAALGLHRAGIRSGDSRRQVVALLERAEVALRGRAADGGLRAQVLAAVARESADGPERDVEGARARAREAERTARAAGDRRALATALFARHDVEWAPGTAGRRLTIAEAMTAAAVAAGDTELEFEGLFCRFVALVELADPRAVTALYEVAQAAERSRLPRARYLVRSREAAMALLRGRFEEGGRLSREAAELAEAIGEPDGIGVAATQRMTAAVARGGPGGVVAVLEEFGDAGLPPELLPHWRCFAALAAGEPEAAAAVLRALPPADDLAGYRWRALAGMAFEVEIAAAAGVGEVLQDRYQRLLPYEQEIVVVGGAVAALAPVSLYLGLAAPDPQRAALHLETALAAAERVGALPDTTRARYELGRVLLARDPGSDRGRRLLALALAAAEDQGLAWLRDRAAAALAHMDTRSVFRRDGEVWTLGYAGRTVRLKDAKGLHDLARLVSCPGQEVPATHLLAGEDVPSPGSDELLDEQARAAYRARLDRLDEEITAARERDDPAGLARAQNERDALIAELRRAYGLGGRPRRLGDAGERARTTVTARIRDTLRRIEHEHPELAAHLSASVTTGRSCAYRPEEPVHWQL
ncbi:ATP-binding protein [Kitasatospora sp. NPDC058218]|uniref:ATP-binding protein n=1 Tax=Kitasatospora sp. NPDC058218 TaxID=3346385 RepID=UPI0036D92963